MFRLKNTFSFFFIAILSFSCIKGEKVDLIVHNAIIHSLSSSDDVFEAMAIQDGKIVELGPERQILNKYRADEIVDAQRQHVYPGFIDAHCHFLNYGLVQQQARLNECNSFLEVIDVLKKHQEKYPEKTWLLGRGWDQTRWENKAMPTKHQLDSAFPSIPVYIKRIDGHAALANSKALEISQLTKKIEVQGGQMAVENGQLTGLLIDNAMNFIDNILPKPTLKEKTEALMIAQQECFKYGLTTVDDAGLDKEDVYLIDSLHKNKTLKMRVYIMLSDTEENFEHFVAKGPIKTDRMNVRSFKFYSDGALGSRGACLLKPYSDVDSVTYGTLFNSLQYFEEKAQKLYDKGFQMNTHCIGDSANRVILNTYAKVLGEHNDQRWRIEHAQIVDSNDFHYFKNFNIIPSVQPTHATSDMRWAMFRVGRQRLKYGYAYKMLYDLNGMAALGTDFPIENISPIETYYAAVARKDKSGKPEEGFQLENALSRREALYGITIWPAVANFEENEKGTLEIGKNADFVIINQDLEKVEQKHILKTRVIATFVAGEKVY
ncbi:MAG: amidohydrolase [Bacteroidia bacterium]